jgi:glyceraldehyde 3-phosphate dehydrogenase
MKLAINGFGRIGRQALKIALNKGLDVVAVNDLTRADELAHLLKFDTVYGTYEGEVKAMLNGQEFTAGTNELLGGIDEANLSEQSLVVSGKEIRVFNQKDPAQLPWGEMQVDVVLECTGVFVKDDMAIGHIHAGAKRVVLSAPSQGDSPAPTYIMGTNVEKYGDEQLISNASCTTNCIAPVMKVMMDAFGVHKAIMTTAHAYTANQSLVDGISKDLRRGRAAAQNIVPSSTGAAIATSQVLPELTSKFDGGSLRVPVITGSISDITFLVKRPTSVEEVNNAFRAAAENDYYKGVIAISDAPLVSSDIIGRSESAIVDLPLTMVVDGDLVKVMAWYDNEWGYSNRLVEIAQQLNY